MKRAYILLWIAVAVLLSASSNTPQPTPRTTPQGHGEAAAEKKPAATEAEHKNPDSPSPHPASSTFVASSESRPTESAHADDSAANTNEEKRHDRREEALEQKLICLTAVLAIIEIATLVVFAITMIANIRAANASKEAAEATKTSANVANKSLKLAERAHVQFSGSVSFRFEALTPMSMSYWLTNAGHTIARIEDCKAELLYSDAAPPSLYDPNRPRPPVDAPDLAAIAREQSFSDSLDLEPDMRDEVRGDAAAKRLWLRGFAVYYDEFDDFHETVWCRYWIPGINLDQTSELAWPNERGLNYAT